MKKTIIILVIIAVFAGVGYAGYRIFFTDTNTPIIGNQTNSGDTPSVKEEKLAEKVTVEAVNVRNKTDNIHIENVYPSIKSFYDKEFENSINKQIANNIAEYRAEINYIVDDLTPEVALYKYITNYDKYTWGDYLTLVINQDYQTGGIRSNTWKDIYNINARTERLIYLEDIFEATTDYETAIIEEVTRQASLKNYKLMGGDGLTKLPTKQKFYIKDGKLIIYFDPSEVAAAEYGELNFEMPFTLNSNGYFQVN